MKSIYLSGNNTMNNMKKIILASLFAFLFTACTQYQFMTVESNIYNQDNQQFVWENDSVRICYSFAGANCPLNIMIYNKLQQPLFVDWQKSAIIYGDGSSFSLWNNRSDIQTQSVSAGVQVGNIGISNTTTTGAITREPQIKFIPPSSHISYSPVCIRSALITPLDPRLKQRVEFGGPDDGKVDMYSYTIDNSPFYFRCYLSLSTSDNFAQSIYVDQPFWVSKIIETKHGPNYFLKSDNQFYVSKTTATGQFLQGVGVASLVAGALYIQTVTPPDNNYHHRHR